MTTPRYTVNTTAGAPSYGQGERAPAQGTVTGAHRTTAADARSATVTLSLDTSAYASADLVADTQLISSSFFDQLGGCAIIDSVCLIDEDDQGVALNLVFTTASTSFGTENAAPSIADADARNIVGHVAVATTDYVDIGNSKIGTKTNLGLVVKSDGSTRSLYLAVVNGSGTPTFTATGVRVKIGYRQA